MTALIAETTTLRAMGRKIAMQVLGVVAALLVTSELGAVAMPNGGYMTVGGILDLAGLLIQGPVWTAWLNVVATLVAQGAVLRRAPARLARALSRVPPRLLARRPAPGQWAVTEVLCHLADAEIALAFRIRKIAAEPGGPLVAWDQDRWADRGGYRRTPAREALATFAALRRANLAYLGRLSSTQRRQHGRHPEYGRLTIPQMLAGQTIEPSVSVPIPAATRLVVTATAVPLLEPHGLRRSA